GGDAANLVFQVVNDRYLHRRPMLFTTNKPLAAWGKVLHDPDLAEAILDRILERGRVIELRGDSYRTRHLKTNHQHRTPEARGGRISGIERPEFPEPTHGIGQIEGDDLCIVIKPWLAEHLRIGEGSLVIVDNTTGKFRITRSAAR